MAAESYGTVPASPALKVSLNNLIGKPSKRRLQAQALLKPSRHIIPVSSLERSASIAIIKYHFSHDMHKMHTCYQNIVSSQLDPTAV